MKSPNELRHALTPVAAALLAAWQGPALANPSGATVVHGNVSIAQPNRNSLQITNSPGAIINWQSFSISERELTRFIQQGQASAVLNRVVGGDPSTILGRLQSNGKVFLINRQGIVFGRNAVINTAGLVASTLNITDADFLAGHYRFVADGLAGSIVNEGVIRAGRNGQVFLIAPEIENRGVISAPGGQVVLAAGRSVTLAGFDLDEVQFEVQAPTDSVVNLGRVDAAGGAVHMFAGTLRHSGEIRAGGLALDAAGNVVLVGRGDVTLEAGSRITANGADGGSVRVQSLEGTTLVSGRVEARGGTGTGGEVQLLGRQVGLAGTAGVDVSGGAGGGKALVGGDFQGANPEVQNAQRTVVAEGAAIRADARVSGDGGRVVVWADEAARYGGSISARGGRRGGDGGFVEVSGKQTLSFTGTVDTRAPRGRDGTLLLDPWNIVVSTTGGTGSVDFVDFLFDAAADVVTVTPAALAGVSSNIFLQAANDISFNSALNTGGKHLTAEAGDHIFVNANITSGGGNVSLTANAQPLSPPNNGDPRDPLPVSGNSQYNIGSPGRIVMASGTTINAGAGNITLDAQGDVAFASLTGADIDIVSREGAVRNAAVTSAINATGFVDISAQTGVRVEDVAGAVGINILTADGGVSVQSAGSLISSADSVDITAVSGDVRVEDVSGGNVVSITANDGNIIANSAGSLISSSSLIALQVDNGSAVVQNVRGASVRIDVAGGSLGILDPGSPSLIESTVDQVQINAENGARLVDVTAATNLFIGNVIPGAYVHALNTSSDIRALSGQVSMVADELQLHNVSAGTLVQLDAGAGGISTLSTGSQITAGNGLSTIVTNGGGNIQLANVSADQLTVFSDGGIAVDGLAETTGGTLVLNATGDLVVHDIEATGFQAVLNSSGGSIFQPSGTINADSLVMQAADGDIGTPVDHIHTGSLGLDSVNAGGSFFITGNGTLSLGTLTASSQAAVSTTAGDIVAAVDSPGLEIVSTSISVSSAGRIGAAGAGNPLDLQGSDISLFADGPIGDTNPVIARANQITIGAGSTFNVDTGGTNLRALGIFATSAIGNSSLVTAPNISSFDITASSGTISINEIVATTPLSFDFVARGATNLEYGTIDLASVPGDRLNLTSEGGHLRYDGSGGGLITQGNLTLDGAADVRTGPVSAEGDVIIRSGGDIELGHVTRGVLSGSAEVNAGGRIFAEVDDLAPEIEAEGVKLIAADDIGEADVAIDVNTVDLTIDTGGRFYVDVTDGGGQANVDLDALHIFASALGIGVDSVLTAANLSFSAVALPGTISLSMTDTTGLPGGFSFTETSGAAIETSDNIFAGAGDVMLQAGGGVRQLPGTRITGKDVSLLAESGDIEIADVLASGNVTVEAGGSIFSADGSEGISTPFTVSLFAGGDIVPGVLDLIDPFSIDAGAVFLRAGGSISDVLSDPLIAATTELTVDAGSTFHVNTDGIPLASLTVIADGNTVGAVVGGSTILTPGGFIDFTPAPGGVLRVDDVGPTRVADELSLQARNSGLEVGSIEVPVVKLVADQDVIQRDGNVLRADELLVSAGGMVSLYDVGVIQGMDVFAGGDVSVQQFDVLGTLSDHMNLVSFGGSVHLFDNAAVGGWLNIQAAGDVNALDLQSAGVDGNTGFGTSIVAGGSVNAIDVFALDGDLQIHAGDSLTVDFAHADGNTVGGNVFLSTGFGTLAVDAVSLPGFLDIASGGALQLGTVNASGAEVTALGDADVGSVSVSSNLSLDVGGLLQLNSATADGNLDVRGGSGVIFDFLTGNTVTVMSFFGNVEGIGIGHIGGAPAGDGIASSVLVQAGGNIHSVDFDTDRLTLLTGGDAGSAITPLTASSNLTALTIDTGAGFFITSLATLDQLDISVRADGLAGSGASLEGTDNATVSMFSNGVQVFVDELTLGLGALGLHVSGDLQVRGLVQAGSLDISANTNGVVGAEGSIFIQGGQVGTGSFALVHSTAGPANLTATEGGVIVRSGFGLGEDAFLEGVDGLSVLARYVEVTANGANTASITNSGAGNQVITTLGEGSSGRGLEVRANGDNGVALIHNSGVEQIIDVRNSEGVLVVAQGLASTARITGDAATSRQEVSISGSGANLLEIGADGAQGYSVVDYGGVGTQLVQVGNAGAGDSNGSIIIRGGDAPAVPLVDPGGAAAIASFNADSIQRVEALDGIRIFGAGPAGAGVDSGISSQGVEQTVTAGLGGIEIKGGTSTSSDPQFGGDSSDAGISFFGTGQQTVHSAGSIVIEGGASGSFNRAGIGSTNVGVTRQVVSTDADLVLHGGAGGTGNSAEIVTTASAGQEVSVAGNLEIVGGGGVGNQASLDVFFDNGTQLVEVGGDALLQGGTADDAWAEIFSGSDAVPGSTDVRVQGNLTLRGGSGGATIDEGTGASIGGSDIQVTVFRRLTMEAGSDREAIAAIGEEDGPLSIDVKAGDILMRGGSGIDSAALIGVLQGGLSTVNVTSADSIRLIGGSAAEGFFGVGGGAFIGTRDADANVNVRALAGDIRLDSFGPEGIAGIGSLSGGANVSVTALLPGFSGGNVNLGDGLVRGAAGAQGAGIVLINAGRDITQAAGGRVEADGDLSIIGSDDGGGGNVELAGSVISSAGQVLIQSEQTLRLDGIVRAATNALIGANFETFVTGELTATGAIDPLLTGNFVFSGNAQVNANAFDASSIRVTGGTVAFNVSNPVTTGDFTLSGGSLAGVHDMNAGGMTWTAGTLGGTGTTTVTGTLTMGGTAAKVLADNRVLVTQGGGTWDGGDLQMGAGNQWINQGSLTVTGARNMTGGIFLNSGGTIDKTGTGTATWNTDLINDGTLNLNAGTLLLEGGSGSFVQTGDFNLASGATLEVGAGQYRFVAGSSITGAGNVSFRSGTDVVVSDTYDVGGTTRIEGAGTVVGFSTLSPSVTGALVQTGGELKGTGPIDVTGNYTMSGGTMTGTGSTSVGGNFTSTGVRIVDRVLNTNGNIVVNSGSLVLNRNGTHNGNIQIASGAELDLAGGVHSFDGSTDIGGAGTLALSGGSMAGAGTLSNSGRLDLRGDQNLGPLASNTGTIVKSGGAGIATFGNAFTNAGTMDVRSGGVAMGSSYTQTAAGTTRVASGTSFSVAGGVTQNGGAINVDGSMSAGSYTKTGGTLRVSNSLNVGGPFSQSSGTTSVASGATMQTASYTQTNGTTVVNGSLLANVAMSGGLFNGTGSVLGNFSQSGGTLAPGASPGTLNIAGDYILGPAATLLLEIAGRERGVSYDLLHIGGVATLEGTLSMTVDGAFAGVVGDLFDMIEYSSASIAPTLKVATATTGYEFVFVDLGSVFQVEMTVVPAAAPVGATTEVVALNENTTKTIETVFEDTGAGEEDEDERKKEKPLCR